MKRQSRAANTASGVAALILNTGGTRNTANGAGAMVFNSAGNDNTGVGYFTLYNNDAGNGNSAVGSDTLLSNVSGDCNVAALQLVVSGLTLTLAAGDNATINIDTIQQRTCSPAT